MTPPPPPLEQMDWANEAEETERLDVGIKKPKPNPRKGTTTTPPPLD